MDDANYVCWRREGLMLKVRDACLRDLVYPRRLKVYITKELKPQKAKKQ